MRTRVTAAVLGAALWAVALPGGVAGQQTDTMALTLAEALRIAESRNPAYRRAVNDLGMNSTELRNTWLNTVLPQSELTLFNTNYTGNIRRRATDNFGNPIENPQAEWAYFSGTNQGLSLFWNVQGQNLWNALRRQRETNRGRDLTEERALQDTRTSVVRQFYDVQEQGELLALERSLAEERRFELELSERLFSLAERSRVDVLNAELGVEQQALTIERQRAAWEQAGLALRTALGASDLPPFRLVEEPVTVFDPTQLDADELTGRALASSASVRQAESAESGALLGVREQKNRWWPSLGFYYNLSRRAQTRESDALFDLSFDEDLDSNFAISLSLPFFNNYPRSSADVQRAEIALDNSRESAREARLAVQERVRSAVLDLKNQHQSLRLTQRALEIAQEALVLAREEYRMGARTFEQLRESVQLEANTQRQLIQARYRFMDALVALEEAVGTSVRVPPAADAAGASGVR